MSNNGPTADQVADELMRKQLLARLAVENPGLFADYQERCYTERLWGLIGTVSGLAVSGFVWWFFVSYGLVGPDNVIVFLVFLIAVTVLTAVMIYFVKCDQIGSEKLIMEFQNKRIAADIAQERSMAKLERKLDENSANMAGNTIVVHEGATFINGGQFINSFNKYVLTSPDLADALKTIAGAVENAANPEAAKAFDNLTKEVSSEKPEPSRIRAFWTDLVALMPEIATLTTAAVTITGLFKA